MIRAVFDSVIFVRALINPFGRWGELLFDRAPSYRLVASPPLISEVSSVLQRPAVVRLFRPLPGRDPAAVIARLAAAELVEIDPGAIPRVSRDSKDDIVLATAKLGSAGYLVSEDNDLLVLDPYDGIRIVTALTFLRVLDDLPAANGRGGA